MSRAQFAALSLKLDKFIAGPTPAGRAAGALCSILTEKELLAYFFGGTLRDVWIGEREPRDLDVVVDPIMWRRFEKETEPWHKGRNRFGGLKMEIEGVSVDAWDSSKTWSFFAEQVLPACVTKLPETTLLNAEAIVMEAAIHPSGPRMAFEQGFFKGVETRTLDLNPIPQIPNRALSAVRIRHMAAKLEWELSPRAENLASEIEKGCGREELTAAELSHYGADTLWPPQISLPPSTNTPHSVGAHPHIV